MANYNGMPPSHDHPFADLPWFVPVLALIFFEPVGVPLAVALFILKKADQKSKEQELLARRSWAMRTYSDNLYNRQQAAAPSQARPAYQAQPAKEKAPMYSRNLGRRNAAKLGSDGKFIVLAIISALFVLAGCSIFVEGLNDFFWGMPFFRVLADSLLPGLFTAGLGGFGVFSSIRRGTQRKREKVLKQIVANRDNIAVRQLSEMTGWPYDETLKTVQKAILHGIFGSEAYIDMRTVTLVVRGEAPEPEPVLDPKTAPENHTQDEYEEILRQLREVNALIPGEEMTAKISRLERACQNIFDKIKKNPELRKSLNKFMDYYLPTALRLLCTYARLETEGSNGENAAATRKNIEDTMDLLVTAFDNQLDKLHENEAFEVSTDINTLKSMLNMDGLDGAGDFNLGTKP